MDYRSNLGREEAFKILPVPESESLCQKSGRVFSRLTRGITSLGSSAVNEITKFVAWPNLKHTGIDIAVKQVNPLATSYKLKQEQIQTNQKIIIFANMVTKLKDQVCVQRETIKILTASSAPSKKMEEAIDCLKNLEGELLHASNKLESLKKHREFLKDREVFQHVEQCGNLVGLGSDCVVPGSSGVVKKSFECLVLVAELGYQASVSHIFSSLGSLWSRRDEISLSELCSKLELKGITPANAAKFAKIYGLKIAFLTLPIIYQYYLKDIVASEYDRIKGMFSSQFGN